MSDLISRDALHKVWCANCDNKHLCGGKVGCDEVKELYDMPTIEINPQELEDRFGKYVRFVVEDMMSGEGKRWKKEPWYMVDEVKE